MSLKLKLKIMKNTLKNVLRKVNFIMSFHASKQDATPKEVTKILVLINKLKYINQIIASQIFYEKFMYENPNFNNFEILDAEPFKDLFKNNANDGMELFKINI